METLDCLVKCKEKEYEGKLDPTKETPAFVTE